MHFILYNYVSIWFLVCKCDFTEARILCWILTILSDDLENIHSGYEINQFGTLEYVLGLSSIAASLPLS